LLPSWIVRLCLWLRVNYEEITFKIIDVLADACRDCIDYMTNNFIECDARILLNILLDLCTLAIVKTILESLNTISSIFQLLFLSHYVALEDQFVFRQGQPWYRIS